VGRNLSALEEQAAAALRRARRLPVGAERNDLRQLAMGLLWLHRNGMEALVKQRSAARLKAQGGVTARHLHFTTPSQDRGTVIGDD
jgi:hypothetical protein